MLLEWVLSFGQMIISAILNILDLVPDMPPQAISVLNNFLNIIKTAFNLLCTFVDINMIRILFPIVLIIINFDFVYRVVMWVLRKIPVLGIE